MRLTLRTLLAYLDDSLDANEARQIGQKLAENPDAQGLVERIRRVARSRSIATPTSGADGSPTDPNVVAAYLSDSLGAEQLAKFEAACLDSDVHLAEVATCHQILTLVLCEQVRIPPSARKRMYQLVKGRESIPDRQPGNLIPVGGAVEDQKPNDDDADASFLLGMSAYSRTESWGRLARRAAVLAGLLVGVVFTIWMAWPNAEGRAEPAAFALVGAPPRSTTPSSDTGTKPTAPSTAKSPSGAKPKTPVKPSVEPMPPEKTEPEPEPSIPGPKEDRVVVGRADRIAAGILVRKSPGAPMWERVMAASPEIRGGDRLVSLPGSKTDVRLSGGVDVHLWGNLPDLLFSPFLDAAATPSDPYPGFDADLTVHTGRIYLSTKQPGGKLVRVRIRSEVWDVRLADEKTEVVIEVTHFLTPGSGDDATVTSIALAVLGGEAKWRTPLTDVASLGRGGQVHWESRGKRVDVRPKADAEEWKTLSLYLDRIQVYPDAKHAEMLLTSLNGFATRLTDPSRVRAVFDEALQGEAGPQTPAAEANTRVALFAFAALGDVTGLATAMMDPRHPIYRVTGNEATRYALAEDPSLIPAFRKILTDTIRLGDDRANEVMRLLRGLSDAERTEQSAATLDRLVANLSSDTLPIREMSFRLLTTFLDPKDPANQQLPYFDAAAPGELRDASIKVWTKRVEELKNKPTTPEQPASGETIPAPRAK